MKNFGVTIDRLDAPELIEPYSGYAIKVHDFLDGIIDDATRDSIKEQGFSEDQIDTIIRSLLIEFFAQVQKVSFIPLEMARKYAEIFKRELAGTERNIDPCSTLSPEKLTTLIRISIDKALSVTSPDADSESEATEVFEPSMMLIGTDAATFDPKKFLSKAALDAIDKLPERERPSLYAVIQQFAKNVYNCSTMTREEFIDEVNRINSTQPDTRYSTLSPISIINKIREEFLITYLFWVDHDSR